MSEVDDYYQNLQLQAQRQNYAAQDDDPDDAAEALALSGSTGVPATAIHDNLEDFQRQHKLALGNKIINDNQYISEYLNSHPLAASVSHDDLGALDEFHRALDNLPESSGFIDWLRQEHDLYHAKDWQALGALLQSSAKALITPPKEVEEAFQGWGQFGGRDKNGRPTDLEFALSHPEIGAVLGGGEMMLQALPRAVNAMMLMGHSNLSSLIGERPATEIFGGVEYFMQRADLFTTRRGGGLAETRQTPLQAGIRAAAEENKLPVPDAEFFRKAEALPATKSTNRLRIVRDHIDRLTDMSTALQIADPWTSTGKEPPYGLHPLIDKAKDLQAKEDIKNFNEAFQKASATATRERSPDIFSTGLKTRLGDRQIGIDPEAVDRLYGDKPPAVDDGLLGWDKDLQSKLDTARLTGDRVWVNMADYFGHTDPEVHKQLLDDIAVRSDSPTKNDLKIEAEPKQVIANDPLAQVKGSAGIEPLFMAGDRKLTLEKIPSKPGVMFGEEQGFHDIAIKDETGKEIGTINLSKQGKKLYIEMIQAGPKETGFYQPNFLGPALVKDIKRQLKAMFPDAETITGHRVSGAREKAGTFLEPSATPEVKLEETPQGWGSVEPMRQLLQGFWAPAEAPGVEARVAPLSLEQQAMATAVQKELERIIPQQVQFRTVSELKRQTPGDIGGFYQRFLNDWPKIVVALDQPELALGIARHEAIHHLRQYGFINDKEWASLEQAARDGDWVKKNLGDRYKNLNEEKRIEEAIAEQFRKWAAKQDGVEGHSVFEKIKDFIDQIKVRYKELTGKDLDWQEFFQKIKEGEVGRREGNVPQEAEPGKRPFQGEGLSQFAEREGFGLYDKGKALGITEVHKQRLEQLMEKQNAEEQAFAQRKAEARLARVRRAEVKERRVQLRDEVREAMDQRPDIASDQFMSKYGVKFHPDYLSEEQKARLPKDYIQKKNGVNPDDLAPYFGYTSGDALVERLGMLTEDRRRSGMSPRDYLNRLVDVETDRRLNQEFGGRDAQDLEDAKDQALSMTAMRRISEETLRYAEKATAAGHQIEAPLTHEDVQAMTKKAFDDLPVGSISRDRMLQTALRQEKKANEAATKGKWDVAYQRIQERQHAVWMAKYAGEYQRERAALDRTAKTMSRREPAKIRAEFVNWIHDLLVRSGYGIGRTIQDLQENISRKTSQTLADFVDEKRAQYRDPDSVPVADFVLDPNFRMKVDDMTYSEFKDFKTSIDALVKAGRDEDKIYVGGEARDRIAFRDEARQDLQSFGYKPSKSEPGPVGKWPKLLFYGITNMETLFDRISRGDPNKPLNQLIMRLAEASNSEARLQREVAKMWEALPDIGDLSKLVDSPITDPRTRGTPEFGPDGSGTWEGFNRGNKIKLLLNAGNEGNWKVASHGYSADPVGLFRWLEKNVTKEEIQFAEAMGDIYKKLIGQYDDVRERMTGATVQKIPLKPLKFKLNDGTTYQSKGWYHPLEADPIRKSVWVQDDAGEWSQMAQGKRDLIGDENYQFSLADGFTKKRTGAIYPLDLDMSRSPHTIDQMIHGISFKEVVKETEKLFSDPLFFEDVAKYYGKNYADGLVPYLAAVAGRKGLPGKNLASARQASEFMRQNVASTYIAFNVGTVAKHFTSAWVFSMRGVGSANYLDAFRELNLQAPSVSKAARDWVDNTFEEVSRREQNWRDTIEGQQRELVGKSNLRQQIMQTGASWVATSDLISARATALAAYKKAKAEGMSEGDSVAMGNRAVRLQHGSTAQTNLPPIVRGSGGLLEPWMTTFYGFFGTAMQRRIETVHKIADAWDLGVKQGEWSKAGKNARSALGDFMVYAFWPTLIEEVVNGIGTDDHRTWLSKLFSATTMGLSSTIPYVRDIARAAATGQDPGAGLFTSLLADQNKIIRDVLHPQKALSRQHAAKTVGDFLTGVGEVTGVVPKPVANIARFATGLAEGTERPQGPLDVARGLYKGTAKERVEK